MKKNFIQKHVQMITIVIVCFLIVPFVRNSYALNKTNPLTLPNQKTSQKAKEEKSTKRRVVLDAGHGGYDDGSVSANGVKEKDVVMEITRYVGSYLENANIDVVYTRVNDEITWNEDNVEDLLERSNITNDANAEYFISIHMNDTIYGNEISGNEVWVQYTNEKSLALATAINNELIQVNYTENRGLKDEAQSPLSLLQFNKIPSVLVEAGFMSSTEDMAVLASEEGKKKAAKAIADGILQTLEKD